MLLKWGSGRSENALSVPCRTSENALFAKQNIDFVAIDLHSKKEQLTPQPSYAAISFLLLHAYTSMLEAKQSHSSRLRKRHSLPKIYDIFCMECILKVKVYFSPKGSSSTHCFCSGPVNPRIEALAVHSLSCKQNFQQSLCQD